MTDELMDIYDVAVLGGGAAGLNGALMLARSRRSVVVLDAGAPRNAPAHAVHGLLGHDGTAPAQLLARGREEVRRYGGQVVEAEVVGASRDGEGFTVPLTGGQSVKARRLLVATGLVDVLPAVPGLVERWGRDVLHCPYCHGWEVRDQAVGVLASGPMSVHQALLFSQLSDDVVYLAHGSDLTAEQAEQLAARRIEVVDGEVASVEVVHDQLAGVRMADGRTVSRTALVVATRMQARAGFLADLGLEVVEHPSGMGEHIPCDPTGRTAVAGVWVAGNVTDLAAQVGASAAAGAIAGAQINADLVMEETRRAVEQRAAFTAEDAADAEDRWGVVRARVAVASKDVAGATEEREPSAHMHHHHGAGATGTVEFWEDFYRDAGPWSGEPNAVLVEELTARPARARAGSGSALDLGCGTGADAIWLAGQGWAVTGVDVSGAALAQAAAAAESVGLDGGISWLRRDLEVDFPTGTWDLVTAAYLHAPVALEREQILRRAAAAVAPGGTLLVIGHQGAPSWVTSPPAVGYPTTEAVLSALDLDGWTVERAETRTVPMRAPDGSAASRTDNLVRVRHVAPHG